MSALAAEAVPTATADQWSEPSPVEPLRYYDHRFDTEAIKLMPGEFFGAADHRMLVTILGSCVAACLWDPEAGVGGMNHFMLPSDGGAGSGSARYGVHAMELLINRLVALGALRTRLRAKLFGGAAVVRSMTQSDVGARNIAFVEQYMKTEGMPVLAADLGGPWPRRVHFFPVNGRVLVKRLPVVEATRIASDEHRHGRRLAESVDAAGDVELFQ